MISLLRVATCALAAMGFLFIVSGRPAEACELQQIAELPVTMVGDAPLVDVSVNGRPVRFLIDTGSSTTLLTRAGAATLGLKPVQLDGVTFWGAGGRTDASAAKAQAFKLGGLVIHNLDMMVTGRVASDRFVGVLGRDVLLSGGDLELDLAHNVVRLTKPKNCRGDEVVYWANSYALVSLGSLSAEMTVKASLNGHAVTALLDSGASRSVVTMDVAQMAGVTPQSQGVTYSGEGLGMGGGVQIWTGMFQSLGVGSETVQNVRLEISDLFSKNRKIDTGSHIARGEEGEPDMLLGADFMRAHRIYIASGQGKAYFTYNGGPIFTLPPPETHQVSPTK